jgi:hypothetical protein
MSLRQYNTIFNRTQKCQEIEWFWYLDVWFSNGHCTNTTYQLGILMLSAITLAKFRLSVMDMSGIYEQTHCLLRTYLGGD